MNTAMKREIVDFSIKVENGVVKEIGKSYVAMPEVHFKGGSTLINTTKSDEINLA